ncbi:hypothetical protein GCM10022291_18200 [Postechiella marina]|uniref:FecR family protein n=1 Tax=Postechiella marina TaxID=943941 RepID=A0ABP8C8T1_9FLAO
METYKILKYLNSTASLKEIKEVETWIIASPENTKTFNFLKTQHILSSFNKTSELKNNEAPLKWYKKKISDSFKKEKKTKWILPLKSAAIITILLGSAYFYKTNVSTKKEVIIPKNVITLQLENGNTKIIKENGETEVVDLNGNTIGLQKGNTLKYQNSTSSDKLAFNTLTVPNGKRFDVVLSDNTHVYLNAGTTLKYPVKFIKGDNREVFLTGEALFEVAKDTNHPFIVNTNDINVRVLGTTFNVSSYPEELTTKTVLVEGSVRLHKEDDYNKDNSTLLKPGQLALANRKANNLIIENVDVSLYTSWINGTLSFKHEPFKNIIKKLERQFNVVITNNNLELNNVLFTASFDNVPLEQILKTFHENYGIQYTIDKTNITLN